MQIEKKEGGRAPEHFVLCDVQTGYSENLLKIFTEKFQGNYRFHLFNDIGKAAEFSKKVSVDIFVAAEEFSREERRKIEAGKRFLLCGTRGRNTGSGEIPLFRYQPADKIMQEIRENEIREGISNGRVRKKKTQDQPPGEEEMRALDHPVRSSERRSRISPETSTKGLIGVYSPVGRIGKTRFAIHLARQLSQKMPVLYLNMEGNAGGSYYFPENPEQNLGDLIYYMRQDGIIPGMKISTMAGQSDGMDYIMPMEYEQDVKNVKKEEWMELLDTILEKCIYEAVILDLGDCIEGLYEILRKCEKVYTLYIDEGTALAKIEQYEKNLRASGYGDVLGRTVKRRVGRMRRSGEKQEI